MKYDVIVVGSGLAGATAANILGNQGLKVLVVERKPHIGGQCYDFKNEVGLTIQKYGPHIFHTSKKQVWDFVTRFTDFNTYCHRVLSCVDGELYDFPINRQTINKLFQKSLSEAEIPVFLQNEVSKAEFQIPFRSFRDAIVSQVGETIYSVFIENYTRKQWGCEPVLLSPDLAGRIVVRCNDDHSFFNDLYQGIPVKGYTEMIRQMLSHQNISVLLGADYEAVHNQYEADYCVYTGELDRFFKCKYGRLEYRSVRLEFQTYEQECFQKVAVVNYPNENEWTRITEFKKFTFEKSPFTTVCYEYPDAHGEPFYVVPSSQNRAVMAKYMKDVEKLEQTGRYIFIGRLAEYKYYNMDDVIEAAINKVQKWLKLTGN